MINFRKTHYSLFLALITVLILAACSPPIAPAGQTPDPETTLPPTRTSTEPQAAPTLGASPYFQTAEPLEADPLKNLLSAFCQLPAELTPPMTEGPFYTPNPPFKTSLIEEEMRGTPVTLSGYVVNQDCSPIPGAYLDFWQADAEGVYDNSGYRLRGHLFSDEDGRYSLETILPGEYPGRTPHIHFKAQAPGGPMLTSQLFFPETPANARDRIFDPRLVVDLRETPDGLVAVYIFVLQAE